MKKDTDFLKLSKLKLYFKFTEKYDPFLLSLTKPDPNNEKIV